MILLSAVPIDSDFLVIGVIVIILAIIIAIKALYQRQTEKAKFELKLSQQFLAYEQSNNDLKLTINTLAQQQFERFKATELNSYQQRMEAASLEAAKVMLERWKIENEERIRKDAANRSVRSVMGKVTEHLIPFSEAFSQFNPKDARFIGSPIDLIVFDGAEEKKEEITIYFIEVKTGTSPLSPRQKKIMEAIQQRRVKWLRLDIKDFGSAVNEML